MSEVKFPDVTVKLIGKDGNAFNIMAIVVSGLIRGGATSDEVKLYRKEAMSGDYDNLIRVSTKWVNVS